MVLSDGSGALEKMLPFFKLGIGGPVAGGKQYVPWVHLDDVVGALVACLDGELRGPVNVTAPEPVTNKEFSKTLGKVLKRPAVAPVPALALKAALRRDGRDRHHRPARGPRRLEEPGYASASRIWKRRCARPSELGQPAAGGRQRRRIRARLYAPSPGRPLVLQSA